MKRYIPLFVILALLIGVYAYWNYAASGKYENLAKCLVEKDVKMYGTSWCPHCQEQKAMFGRSWKFVPYVECANANNPKEQTQLCKEAAIESYPTWQKPDGESKKGAIKLEELATWAGCEI